MNAITNICIFSNSHAKLSGYKFLHLREESFLLRNDVIRLINQHLDIIPIHNHNFIAMASQCTVLFMLVHGHSAIEFCLVESLDISLLTLAPV